jgi:hypothetical protein
MSWLNSPFFSGGTKSPLTTKGDLFGFNTDNARIPVGVNGQVLKANSAVALGVEWGPDIAGGGDLFRLPSNVLWKVSGQPQIDGVRYQSINNAIDYLYDDSAKNPTHTIASSSGGVATLSVDDGRLANHWQNGTIKITSGTYSGIYYPVTASTGTTITATGLPDGISSGTTYEIVKTSNTNRWGIYESGINAENLSLPDHVFMIGNAAGVTRFIGEIKANGSNECGFINCEIDQFANTSATAKFAFFNTRINGTKTATTINAAQIVMLGVSEIKGGDFSTVAGGPVMIFDGLITGGSFPSLLSAWNARLLGPATFNGAIFHDCYITSVPTFNQGNYTLNGGTWGKNHTIGNGNTFSMYNVSIISSTAISVDSNSTFYISGNPSRNLTITDIGGTIYATGVSQGFEFDNGSKTADFDIDWNKGHFQKVLLNLDNLNMTFTDPNNIGFYTLKIIQDPSVGDRDLTSWPVACAFPGGTPPTLSNGLDDVDMIVFYFDGTTYNQISFIADLV